MVQGGMQLILKVAVQCVSRPLFVLRIMDFFLSYEGASKEESHIILKEGLFTSYDLFLPNTSKESKDISPHKLGT